MILSTRQLIAYQSLNLDKTNNPDRRHGPTWVGRRDPKPPKPKNTLTKEEHTKKQKDEFYEIMKKIENEYIEKGQKHLEASVKKDYRQIIAATNSKYMSDERFNEYLPKWYRDHTYDEIIDLTKRNKPDKLEYVEELIKHKKPKPPPTDYEKMLEQLAPLKKRMDEEAKVKRETKKIEREQKREQQHKQRIENLNTPSKDNRIREHLDYPTYSVPLQDLSDEEMLRNINGKDFESAGNPYTKYDPKERKEFKSIMRKIEKEESKGVKASMKNYRSIIAGEFIKCPNCMGEGGKLMNKDHELSHEVCSKCEGQGYINKEEHQMAMAKRDYRNIISLKLERDKELLKPIEDFTQKRRRKIDEDAATYEDLVHEPGKIYEDDKESIYGSRDYRSIIALLGHEARVWDMKSGSKVVVIHPTKGLPAFSVSGTIYTVKAIASEGLIIDKIDPNKETFVKLAELPDSWWPIKSFELYETKQASRNYRSIIALKLRRDEELDTMPEDVQHYKNQDATKEDEEINLGYVPTYEKKIDLDKMFGLGSKKDIGLIKKATDSIACPGCGHRFDIKGTDHGSLICPSCGRDFNYNFR